MKILLRSQWVSLSAVIPICLVLATTAFGGTQEAKTLIEEPILTKSSGWEFRLEGYGWLTALNGTTGIGGVTTNVDASFADITSYLKMAAAMEMEIRNGRWGVLGDGFYAELGGGGNPPGPLYSNVDLDMKQVIAQLALAYRILEGPKGFVDIYGGFRYNYISLDLTAAISSTGVQKVSQKISERIFDEIAARARQAAAERLEEFKAAAEASRPKIENAIKSSIASRSDSAVARILAKETEALLRQVPKDATSLDARRTIRAVRSEQTELARATSDLQVAKMRQQVGDNVQDAINRAVARVNTAEKNLAKAIEKELKKQLPVSGSGEEQWFDPIIGLRGQWNITDRVFLAANGDIGGFGVGSELTWLAQATVGYNFTKNLFSEIGYRYLYTDFVDGGFSYDMSEFGLFIGFGVKW